VNATQNELGVADPFVKLSLQQSSGKLPPSSVQRFLREDAEIPAVVLSNYDTSYKNQ